MNKQFLHIPVLLNEAVESLEVGVGKKYIDGTLGGGGHTKDILEHGGIVMGIDQDEDALESVKQTHSAEIQTGKLKVVKGNFSNIVSLATENGFEKVDGILLDIGVSSYQIDASGRGFSIRRDEELDMRMDMSSSLTAKEVVNTYAIEHLTEIFYLYGEEHNARKIAQAIGDIRKRNPITTTKELAGIIERLPHKSEAIHPATRVFQAIRIEVNDELGALKKAIIDGISLLLPQGRMVVISFHSLEDRIVKQTFEKLKREGMGTVVTKKPLTATFEEIEKNKRSRSAKMRVFEKI